MSLLRLKGLRYEYSRTGSARYGPVDYSGALYVKGSEGSDYVGVVFGYQSNRKFYVVMWRKENSNFQDSNTKAGIKGVQLKVRVLPSNGEYAMWSTSLLFFC